MRTQPNECGFMLVGVIGLLLVFLVMGTVLMPNIMTSSSQETKDFEAQHLNAIAIGSENYLRSVLAWPVQLLDLTPGYVPFNSVQLVNNDSGYPRYFTVHPNTSGFTNAVGLSESALPDARFLLVSNVLQDAAPTITNATEFETWWGMDQTATPGLHIGRGNTGKLFQKLTLEGPCAGGSYEIDGIATNSAGATLATHTMYHLKGTTIGLDDANTYTGASPEITLALNTDAGYRHCGDGWYPGADGACGGGGTSFTVRDEFNAGSFSNNDGTANWSNAWQESGESDGTKWGDLRVKGSGYGCASGWCLWVHESTTPKQISREVDLSSLSCGGMATLTFSYLRDWVSGSGLFVTLEASGDGGVTWTTLQTYPLDGHDDPSHVPQTIDITPYIASNTQIRFTTTGIGPNAYFFVEDLQIEGS